MSILAKVTPAPLPRTDSAKQMSLLYAGILVVLLVAQLFTFDTFLKLFPSLNLPLGEVGAYALAPIIVASELFALPFLLRMQLSMAFRWLSMTLGLFVPVVWLIISYWVALLRPYAETVGFLGTAVNLVPGWWAVMVSLALGILAIWASWGLWPGLKIKTNK